MAEDSRKPSSDDVEPFKALPRDPNQPEHKRPRAFIHRPNEEADLESKKRELSLLDAAQTIKLEDFSKVGQTPCARNALLPGIGAGIGIGATRFVIGGSVLAASNWASGCFIGVSLLMYQFCQRRREQEKEGIRQAVQVLDQKQALKDSKTGQPLVAGGQKDAYEVAAQRQRLQTQARAQQQTLNEQQMQTQRPGDPSKQGVPFWNSFKFW